MHRHFMIRRSDPVGRTVLRSLEGRKLRSRSGCRLFPCLVNIPPAECCSSAVKTVCDLTARFFSFRQVSLIKALQVKISSGL